MSDSFLAQIWPGLTPDDLRWLKKAVRSPWFNQRADVIRLFDFIYEHGPGLKKERVFARVWPGEKFDESRFRYALSFLVQLIRSCLAASESEADPVREKLLLAAAMRRRGLDRWFEQAIQEGAELLEKQPMRHAGYFQKRHELQFNSLKINELASPNFVKTIESFSVHVIAETLRLACSTRRAEAVTKEKIEFPFLKNALDCLENRPELQDFLPVKIWFSVFQMLDRPNETAHFFAAKKLLAENWQAFPPSEMGDAWRAAINFCIRRQNLGEREFAREAFELYQNGLENQVLLENGRLSKQTYLNIFSLAFNLDEYAWAEVFLEKNRPFLPEKERENTWRLGSAILFFRKNEYQKVLERLQTVEFTDVFEALRTRQMLLVSFYELGAWESVNALLDSFSHFISRKKTLGYHKENYRNLIRFIRRLVSLKRQSASDGRRTVTQKTRDEMAGLRLEIESAAVAEREWLLSKF